MKKFAAALLLLALALCLTLPAFAQEADGWVQTAEGKWQYLVAGAPLRGLQTDLPGHAGETFLFDTDGTLLATTLGEGWTPSGSGPLAGVAGDAGAWGALAGGKVSPLLSGGGIWMLLSVAEFAVIVYLVTHPEKRRALSAGKASGNTAETADSEETPAADTDT